MVWSGTLIGNVLPTFLLAAPPNPSADFARCVRALRTHPAYAVAVTATTAGNTASITTSATLAVRANNWISLDVRMPAEAGHGALRWICEIHGRTVRAYDPNRRAYIAQTFKQALPAAAALNAQFGHVVPDPIQRIMSPSTLDKFFAPFSRLRGWRRSLSRTETIWAYRKSGDAVKFSFSRTSGRLLHWEIIAAGTTTWQLTYPSLAAVPPLRIPADAVRVETFRLPPPRPLIADPGARAVVERCFAAYERAFRFSAKVSVDGAAFRMWRNSGSVEEVGPRGGWRWSPGELTVWPKGGKVFTGATTLSRVRAYLQQFNVDAEPLALTVLNDDNYAGELFSRDYTVTLVGAVTLHGDALTLLQLAGPAVRVDVGVDAGGLIRRVDSSAYDRSGKLMLETVREIDYADIGETERPPTAVVLPLPKLKPPPNLPRLPAPTAKRRS